MTFIGLNLGSGQRPFRGWINIDAQDREHAGKRPDLVCDAAHLPYPDGYADVAVAHHVLEHFGLGEADGLVKEAHRVLKRGGSFLVFVPDLRILAKRWLTHQLDTQLYFFQLFGAYMGDEHDRHKQGFDAEYLTAYLKKFPWSVVKPFDWRNVHDADIAQDFYIIGMECIK